MCGILGIIGPCSSVTKEALRCGTQALAHRGPDDEGTEILPFHSDQSRCLGMGVRRLAILDLSVRGHQPMSDTQRRIWLAYNGEIYNFVEVRRWLQALGHQFTSSGVTEIVLKAFAEWGAACVEQFRGMFAFAVWDERAERLWLIRDRLGVKPLYYYENATHFLFSSEVRALLATGLLPRRLDSSGVQSYLAFGSVQDPLTIVEGVRSLPAGTVLRWEKGRTSVRAYWKMAEIASRPLATRSVQEATAVVRAILLDAVSLRLVSDVPVGIFLSGGVDSSAVLSLAREVSQRTLDTFSVVFGEHSFSEADHSDLVARAFATRHHRIVLTEQQLLDQLPHALRAMDQPTVDGINTFVLSGAVKDQGVTVALSGLGGDEIFAGYHSFRSIPRMLKFQKAALRSRSLWKALRRVSNLDSTNPLSKLLALGAGDYAWSHPYYLARTLFLPEQVQQLFPAETPRTTWKPGLDSGEAGNGWPAASDVINEVSVLEGSNYLVNTLLRDTDCMSMAHSLEVREPLLDHKLWEYVLPLPGRMKVQRGLQKPLLLEAVGRLPAKTYQRRKMGFTLPFQQWLRRALRPLVERELLAQRDGTSWPLNQKSVAAVWAAFLGDRTSWSRVWALFVLKSWVRHHIGEPA